MQRAKQVQQKVSTSKKTIGLSPSRCYYSITLWCTVFSVILTTAYTQYCTIAPCGDKLQLVFLNLLTGVHCTVQTHMTIL